MLLIAGADIYYGARIAAVRSGSYFFVIWFMFAAALIVSAVLTVTGKWTVIPFALRLTAAVPAVLFFAGFAVSLPFIINGFCDNLDEDAEYIIVLGSQVKADGPAVVLRFRLDRAAEYLERHPDAKCVVSGGQGSNEPFTEAYGMSEYLKNKGIAAERLILEDRSLDTAQNLANTAVLIDKDARIGILSSNFHICRALKIARKCGYSDIFGIGAESVAFYLPNNILREYMAFIKEILCRTI